MKIIGSGLNAQPLRTTSQNTIGNSGNSKMSFSGLEVVPVENMKEILAKVGEGKSRVGTFLEKLKVKHEVKSFLRQVRGVRDNKYAGEMLDENSIHVVVGKKLVRSAEGELYVVARSTNKSLQYTRTDGLKIQNDPIATERAISSLPYKHSLDEVCGMVAMSRLIDGLQKVTDCVGKVVEALASEAKGKSSSVGNKS